MNSIYTVSVLTENLRKIVTSRFPFIWVKGEVTNCSRAPSGHIYFNLKDSQAQLQCVWFASRQRQAGRNFDPLTGEVYAEPAPEPEMLVQNGAQLLCAGALDIYGARGAYQLIVELAQQEGTGRLALEFEQRKARLAALGYFAPERKKALPVAPLRLALVTSPHGAAIHDFLELAGKRGISSKIRLFPVPVQGQGAAEKIAAAIELANGQNWAELIVVIRGGGSLEDLWAFNEECLARAIFESELPVLAGIGHEVDFTLADLTADVRAATPSHAAQLLWPLRTELWQRLDNVELELAKVMHLRLARQGKDLEHLANKLQWLSPVQKIGRLREQLDNLSKNLRREMELGLNSRLSGFTVLERNFHNLLVKGRLQKEAEARLDRLTGLLADIARRNLAAIENQLDKFALALQANSPEAPLKRGYALLTANGKIVSSIADVETGEAVRANMQDGALDLTVVGKLPL